MKYSNQLNLGEILKDASPYVVMRRSPDFPNYYQGQDVDLLVANMGEMVTHIATMVTHDLYQFTTSPTHIQLDFYNPGLNLKFDLYSHHISSKLTSEILANRFPMRIKGYTFSMPQPEMDNILKCYEYLVNKKGKYIYYARFEPLLKQYYEI